MYLRFLNYKDTLMKVTDELYGPRKYYMLMPDEKINCVSETHARMKKYVLKQKKNFKRNGLH
jgi:hypothetical protein